MLDLPFHWRALLLIVVLALVAGVELAVRGRQRAVRWREYGFLLGGGLVGGLFGAGFDQVSFAVSPEYFEVGKGLEPGPGLRLRVTYLGFQAGLVAGLLIGGALLVARGSGERALPLRELARGVPLPLAGALACAPLGALLGPLDPFGYSSALDASLGTSARIEAFLRVWGMHAGLYLGGLAGAALAVVRARRARRAPSVAAPPDDAS